MRKGTAYYDFDDTIIHGDSILYWSRFVYQRYPKIRLLFWIQWIGILLWLIRVINSTQLKCLMLMPTAYLSTKERQTLAQEFGEKVLPFHAFPDILNQLKNHQIEGHRVVILSASGDFYLKYIQSWTGADVVVGTTILFPETGFFRFPRYQIGNFKGVQKTRLLDSEPELFPKEEESWGYSDHHSDQYLLKWVKYAHCVAPNRKLNKIASKHKWKVIQPFYPLKKLRSKRDRLQRLYLMLFAWL